ncbi:hypothetical protein CR513_00803, partial [Mucuna pruriens]
MDTWWVDSGATTHISVTMQGYLSSRPPSDDERFIFVGNENKVLVESFKAEVELQLGKKIKVIKSDRGDEYYGRYDGSGEQRLEPFALFLKECEIVSQYTMSGKPSMNDWQKVEYQTFAHLGCSTEAWPSKSHERKLDSRIVSCYFVGYAERSRGYTFYDPTSKSFFEMGNRRILEEVEFGKEENIRNVVFEEEYVNDIGDNVQTIVPDIVPEQDYNEVLPQTPIEQPQQPQEVPLRRSIRKRRHEILDDYVVFLQEHDDDIGLTKDDLINFCQAMQSSNCQKWIDAMKDELKSMQDNNVWDLVELLEGVKPIDCKWIFKTKKDSKGNIKRYKIRLVAKGFTQKEGIDYKETFYPILRDRSQGILRLSQENYINKVLERFSMKDSKSGDTLIAKGDKFSLK